VEFRGRGTGPLLLVQSRFKGAIQAFVTELILLKSGRLVREGEREEVMDYYNALLLSVGVSRQKFSQQAGKDKQDTNHFGEPARLEVTDNCIVSTVRAASLT